MAKVNNSEVIQKLVDELGLQVGSDVVPTETADKILPVFQINSDSVEVSAPTANIVKQNEAAGATPATIYTTPATGSFYLTNVTLSSVLGDDVTTGIEHGFISVDIDGTTVKILCNAMKVMDAGTSSAPFGMTAVLNLQNPVLVDAGSNIVINNSNANVSSIGTIVGYTTD